VARDGNNNAATATGTTLLNDGAWHHLAGVRQGTTVRIYVDGVQQNAVTNPSLGPVNDFCSYAFIGATNTNQFCATTASEAFFKGLVDEIQVFRRANDARDSSHIQRQQRRHMQTINCVHTAAVELSCPPPAAITRSRTPLLICRPCSSTTR
jgi:Concanavalin A-like lectin/glucanases superfamily